MAFTIISLHFLVLATLNERFRHCISMTKMLNTDNILSECGLDPQNSSSTADHILYQHALEQCQSAALDELFGNPGECFQVMNNAIILVNLKYNYMFCSIAALPRRPHSSARAGASRQVRGREDGHHQVPRRRREEALAPIAAGVHHGLRNFHTLKMTNSFLPYTSS